ncbi:MAG TPA: 23S rRNA (guanosine(2251)-2'-O)-methyltransferase RlmB [Candidatus Faecalibacterium intestinigallinarum]|uniref:23S rRNA (Guanosine(2251)-2'-O)-methyltransferase RlmB n=1 Tax=Candidatus Faecalibacterium intestinigallinarum TaxID=2838581 RepID=A0A9D1QA18_9FIRM|nr:23S rRNA (guanosine(2251)-2'-O)-methyltransferase RlmB [Candidatus Faecalibacterium intestinigallinarum]
MQDNRPRPGRRPEPEREAQPALPNERLVYGKNPVAELLKSGAGVDTVLLAEGMAPAVASYYTALAKEAGAAVKRVHPNKLRQLAGTDSHQGVAAFASEIAYAEVDDLLAAARAKGEAPFLVISDGIEDPHNLGAVIRSALLCGVHGIIIPKRGGAQVTSTVLKASAGAAERLPVARVVNIAETVRCLKEEGVFVYCADMDGVSLRKNNLTGPIALVLGSEGSGVSQLVKKRCDGVLRLEMAAPGTGVDSFNVSVAAGIILYEIQAQRAGNL